MTRLMMTGAALLALCLSLPATAEPKRYEIDPTHTFPSFAFSHMRGSKSCH